MHANRIVFVTFALAATLALTGCSNLSFSPGEAPTDSAAPAPTQTTSTGIDTVVKVDGVKYKVVTTTYVLTWQKADKSIGADNYRVVTVLNREGKTLYTRKVFDDSAWLGTIGGWTVKQPNYKNLAALKAVIVDAT